MGLIDRIRALRAPQKPQPEDLPFEFFDLSAGDQLYLDPKDPIPVRALILAIGLRAAAGGGPDPEDRC